MELKGQSIVLGYALLGCLAIAVALAGQAFVGQGEHSSIGQTPDSRIMRVRLVGPETERSARIMPA